MLKVTLDYKLAIQLETIRRSGDCNMLDYHCVQRRASESDFFELVNWMVDHKRTYARLVFRGYSVISRDGVTYPHEVYFEKYAIADESLGKN